MIRICFTVIAYIISFISHSNQLEAKGDQSHISEQRNQIEYAVETNPLKEENDLEINHLN